MNDFQTMPANDINAETIVVGNLLNNSNLWLEYSDSLNEELFTDGKNIAAYKAIKAVVDSGKTPTLITVTNEVCSNKTAYPFLSVEYLCTISDSERYTSSEFRDALDILVNLKRRRELWVIGNELEKAGTDRNVSLESTQTNAINKLNSLFDTSTSGIKSLKTLTDDFWKNVIEANSNGIKKNGLNTGFTHIDENLGGFHFGNLVVIAADSTMGKTTFAMNIAYNMIKNGNGVTVISMEMTAYEIIARLIAPIANIDSKKILNLKLENEEKEKSHKALEEINEFPLYMDEHSVYYIDDIIASIRTMVFKKHIKAVVIDYLQLIKCNAKIAGTKESQTGDIVRDLKNLAKELNIVIILLSQLRRDNDDPRPNVTRLRNSGQINEAADITILIYRPEYYETNCGKKLRYPSPFENESIKNTAMIDIQKGRTVGNSKFIVDFHPQTNIFTERNSCTNQQQTSDNSMMLSSNELGNTPHDSDYDDLPF